MEERQKKSQEKFKSERDSRIRKEKRPFVPPEQTGVRNCVCVRVYMCDAWLCACVCVRACICACVRVCERLAWPSAEG